MKNLVIPRRDTELLLVGCMLYQPDLIGNIVEKISAVDLYHQDMRDTFTATVSLWNNGDDITPEAVSLVVREKD